MCNAGLVALPIVAGVHGGGCLVRERERENYTLWDVTTAPHPRH